MIPRITIFALLTFSGIYLYETMSIPLDPWGEDDLMNSRTLPYLYGVCLVACLIAHGYLDSAKVSLKGHYKKLFMILISLGLFAYFLDMLGLWISLALLIAANMSILGHKKPLSLVSISLIFPTLGWLIVEKAMAIVIPI